MKRKIYNRFIDWKQKEKGRVALLVEGARRIGKSYIVEAFAKETYEIESLHAPHFLTKVPRQIPGTFGNAFRASRRAVESRRRHRFPAALYDAVTARLTGR